MKPWRKAGDGGRQAVGMTASGRRRDAGRADRWHPATTARRSIRAAALATGRELRDIGRARMSLERGALASTPQRSTSGYTRDLHRQAEQPELVTAVIHPAPLLRPA